MHYLNNKLAAVFIILSAFILVGCNEATRIVKNEIHSVACDSDKSKKLLFDLFEKNLASYLKNSDTLSSHDFNFKINMIHTSSAAFGSSKKSCSALVSIYLPSNFLEETEEVRKGVYEINNLELDFGDDKKRHISLDISENESIYSYLNKNNINISNDEKEITFNVSYSLITSDNGDNTNLNIENNQIDYVFNVIHIHQFKKHVANILQIIEKAKERNEKEKKLNTIAEILLSYTNDNGQRLLNSAYELSLGALKFREAELINQEILENGQSVISIRLNYLNLFDAPHYIVLTSKLDEDLEIIDISYTAYSDVIKPNSLTFESVIQAIQGSQ